MSTDRAVLLNRAMDDPSSLFYLSAGPLLAIVLGMALAPLRGVTTASNFTFAFLALTIAAARLGGRWPAVATALCSALSLDFFLTQPYRRLAIADKHDTIAFVGLAACGLIAAVLGRPRGEKWDGLMRTILRACTHQAALENQLVSVLRATRDALPLRGIAVRDVRNAVVASAIPGEAPPPIPGIVLVDDTLDPADMSEAGRAVWFRPLPSEGGRVALFADGRRQGWLDVWGNGANASASARQTLADVARLVAILLARGEERWIEPA